MRRYLLLIVGTVLWVAADQWSKIAMVDWLVIGDLPEKAQNISSRVHVVSEAFFKFRVVGNPGAAWGLFRGLPDSLRVPFFVLISLVAIGAIGSLYHRARDDQRLLKWALTFVLGGAIGNLIDRIRTGYVIDFVEWSYYEHTWPNFNVADVAISLGVGLIVLEMILDRKRDDEVQKTAQPPSA
ncbi:MAG: signal peptidase II [Myxococcales bacterium]|nr:signal peptidase II [Myxococcales bacterium]